MDFGKAPTDCFQDVFVSSQKDYNSNERIGSLYTPTQRPKCGVKCSKNVLLQ